MMASAVLRALGLSCLVACSNTDDAASPAGNSTGGTSANGGATASGGSAGSAAAGSSSGGAQGGSGGGSAAGASGTAGTGGQTSGTGGGSAAGGGGSSDGSAGTGGDTGVWRPFNDASPWNTPIPNNPELDPDSGTMITDFQNSSQFGAHLDVNIAGFSIPLFYADSSTPTVDMLCDLGGEGFVGNMGSNAHANVPMPQGAAPDPQSDHHLLIVDRGKALEWGMWNTRLEAGQWRCGLGATADLNGTGVRPYKPTNPTWYTSHGARACGFPLVAGLIRVEEIDAGAVEHALIVAYPHIRAGFYTSPASTAQAKVGTDSIATRGIPCGGHIQLDPALDLTTLGLSPAGIAIATALQKYGAYVGDYSGSLSLYAENSPAAQTHWSSGVLDSYEFRDKLDLGKLRVLKLGTLTDDGNGN